MDVLEKHGSHTVNPLGMSTAFFCDRNLFLCHSDHRVILLQRLHISGVFLWGFVRPITEAILIRQ